MAQVIQQMIRHAARAKLISASRQALVLLTPRSTSSLVRCTINSKFHDSVAANFSTSSLRHAADRNTKTEPQTGKSSGDKDTHRRIDELVHANKIVVFMKGVPNAPQCGFSNAVVQILRMHGVDNFDAHNVLDDESLRKGIKEYSSWPTIPQIYINGEFVGGSDILMQLHQSGELIDELSKAGISSSLVDKALKEQERRKPAESD